MNNLYMTFMAVCISLMVAMSASATVPDLIPVQGVLSDTDGAALEGAYDIVFSIYDASDAATALWTDTFTGVDVASGFFTVYLGANAPLNFVDLLANGELWLGVNVAGDGEMERIQMAAVPFAMEALVCQQLGSLTEASINADFMPSTYVPDWADLINIPADIADGDDDTVGFTTEGELTALLDDNYAPSGHNHDSAYAPIGHNHDSDYAPLSHTHADKQDRVTGTCAAGSSIRAINENGTVICEVDNSNQYSAGTGLNLTSGTFSVVPTDFMAPIQEAFTNASIDVVGDGTFYTVQQDSITVPVAGTILVNCSASAWADNLDASNVSQAIYHIISDDATTSPYASGRSVANEYYHAGMGWSVVTISTMKRFAVAAGTHTYYWRLTITDGDVGRLTQTNMSLIFIPN